MIVDRASNNYIAGRRAARRPDAPLLTTSQLEAYARQAADSGNQDAFDYWAGYLWGRG